MTIEGISNSITSVTVVSAPYGAAGPAIAGTSKSGNDIGLGHKVFTMEEGHLSFGIGVRVRATALSESGVWLEGLWLEGTVSYFSGLTLELESDLVTGVGNYAHWSINVAGEPGEKGLAGSAGAPGAPGAPGGAPIDSPLFTGNPRAPTQATADNDTSIATTAFVHNVVATYQPLDADLTALAALSGTNIIYYRSATDVWSPITIGANVTFTGGVLSASVTGGTGNVNNVGTPVNGQLAQWTGAATIQGIDASSLGFAPLASPTLSGDPKAPTPSPGDNDTSISTTAFVREAVDTSLINRVIAPGTNSANFVPRWSAVNSKTLVDGLAVGTGPNNLVQLDGTSKLPAVDGSALSNLTLDPDLVSLAAASSTNDIYYRSAANTWSPVVIGANMTFSGGTLASTGGGGGGAIVVPQGRLTLQTGTPVMTTTQSAKTTIFYTPYCGVYVPLYNGTTFAMIAFTELSVATTDTAKNPAAIGASKVNDWFVWDDAGTRRLTHGPDWTSDTARSATLVLVSGVWLNNAAITNGPAAQRGTYVGTTRSNASSQLDWIYGTLTSGGGKAALFVWNAYNRVDVSALVGDTTDSHTNSAATWMPFLNSANNAVDFVCGLAEDAFSARLSSYGSGDGAGPASIGIGYDVTNVFSGTTGTFAAPGSCLVASFETVSLGKHTINAIECGSGTSGVFCGDLGLPLRLQAGLYFRMRM